MDDLCHNASCDRTGSHLFCACVCVCGSRKGGRVCLFVLASVWFENSVVSLRCACIYALFFACCCCRKLVHTSGRARFSPLFMLSGRIRSVNNDDGREKTKTTTSSGTTIGLCCRCCRLFVYLFESDVCKRVQTCAYIFFWVETRGASGWSIN